MTYEEAVREAQRARSRITHMANKAAPVIETAIGYTPFSSWWNGAKTVSRVASPDSAKRVARKAEAFFRDLF